jgi:hypothetical protein
MDNPEGPGTFDGQPCWNVAIASGPSKPAYDTMRIATWALLIVGALTVAVGLTRYARPGPEAVAALTAQHDPARKR